MLFLTAIYEEMSLSYSVLGLTEKECRAVMNEKIAAAALLWDEENYDEEGEFLTRSNMASVCLKHFQEWGWLKQDYDEALNSYVVTFPEYSQMYVELFRSLLDEQESEERESVMTIYSHLYTYSSDKEKNNSQKHFHSKAYQCRNIVINILCEFPHFLCGFTRHFRYFFCHFPICRFF